MGRKGLSPPERGNPHHSPAFKGSAGPIPARAGEPSTPRCGRRSSRAYPRPSGGTMPACLASSFTSGLSPPERGNHLDAIPPESAPGPIPARAGEPGARGHRRRESRAYPRPSGGTGPSKTPPVCSKGLSPPERGNRWISAEPLLGPGPIPARAGEPKPSARGQDRCRAYPRPSGGTCRRPLSAARAMGLSPPERGNPKAAAPPTGPSGPIPARAGEPSLATLVRAK